MHKERISKQRYDVQDLSTTFHIYLPALLMVWEVHYLTFELDEII